MELFSLLTILLVIASCGAYVVRKASGDSEGQGLQLPGDLASIKSALDLVAELAKSFRAQELQNIVVPIGESGVGKTTLARYLTDDPNANNELSTGEYKVYGKAYSVERRNPKKGTQVHSLFMGYCDYRGQNLGTLVSGLSSGNDINASDVNSVVLIVDLFPPPRNMSGAFQEDTERRPMPDEERIAQNLAKWNEEILQVLLSPLNRNALKCVVLFINKVDLISSEEGRERAVDAYQPLVERLEMFTVGLNLKVHVMLGSIRTGENCLILRDLLLRKAVFV